MSKYDTYKETDVIWFKELPAHWKRKRVKDVTQTLAGGTPDTSKEEYWEGSIPWLPSGKVQNSIINEEDADTFITEEGLKNSATKMLPAPATLIALTGATCSNIGYLTFDACANQSVVGMPGSSKILPKFLFYTLQSQKEQILLHQTGGAQGGISESDVKFLFIPVPIESEQLTIANYLDDQTQKIDRLIANKKAQAEKLKELRQIEINNAVTKGLNPNVEMKDSGIEWLGKIPKHWTTKRMKDVASVRGRIGFRGYTVDDIVDEGALVIGAKHINSSNQLNFDDPEYISWEKYYESPEIMVEVGDVLIVQRGSVGKFALVEKEIGPATINPSMILLRLNTRIHPQFLFWYLLGEHMFNIIKTIVSSTAVPMISQMQAGVFRIILPPKKEQIEIANYLMERTAAIDQLIKNIEAQIEKLQELRKIKIYEAVTGKICLNQDFQDARINRI